MTAQADAVTKAAVQAVRTVDAEAVQRALRAFREAVALHLDAMNAEYELTFGKPLTAAKLEVNWNRGQGTPKWTFTDGRD